MITTLGAIAILSWIIIIFVGILKDFNIFAKANKNIKRAIYFIIDAMLAFGFSALYLMLFKIGFSNYIEFSIKTLSTTLALYATYENTTLKELVRIAKEKIVATIGKDVIKKNVDKIINKDINSNQA